MSEDLRKTLDRELYDGSPPMTITAESLLSKGHRDRRNRRAWGLTGGLAVLMAAGVAIGNLPGAQAPTPIDVGAPASSAPVQPVDLEWTWRDADLEHPTNQYTDRLNEKFGAAMESIGLDPSPAGEHSGIRRSIATLVSAATGTETDGVFPGTNGPVMSGKLITYDGERSYIDTQTGKQSVNYTAFGPGTFVEGYESAPHSAVIASYDHLLASCDSGEVTAVVPGVVGPQKLQRDATCSETKTAAGERVLVEDSMLTLDAGGAESKREVVVYRADGAAVRLTVLGDGQGKYPLSVEQLLKIEKAMPDLPVE